MNDIKRGRLSRPVPARTKTVVFIWVKRDWLPFNDMFRHARRRSTNPMDACKWCMRKFEEGEMMSLARPTKGRNWALCATCADKAVFGECEGMCGV